VTALRRSLFLGASALLLLSLPVGGAVAADLDDVLTDAQDSTYTASRLIVSLWGGQTQVTRELVEHADGMEMVRRGAGWSMAGKGKAASMGETPAGVTFLTKQTSVPSTRYTIKERAKVDHMSRPCRIVDVMEGDILRASLVVDDRSGALLIQEQFSGTGDLFRRTTLSDFRAYRTYEAPMEEAEVPMEVVMPEDSVLLPEDAAGYALVDAFSAPGGSEQGYFSDGLFRFSLFVLNGRTLITGFEEPMTFATAEGAYDMVATAQSVRLHWRDGANNYVLVGDVPPDHLRNILADLPAPDSHRMWERWWQKLFG
jgi:hypothetical protein